MTREEAFANLRDVLADLYSQEPSARRVAHDAGLDGRKISFSTQATNNWHGILTEAEHTNRANALIAIALKEYPDNEGLRAASAGYQRFPSQRNGKGSSARYSQYLSLRQLYRDTITVLLVGTAISITGYVLYLQTYSESSIPLWVSILAPFPVGIWIGIQSSSVSSFVTYILAGLGSGLLNSLGVALSLSIYYSIVGNGSVNGKAILYLYFFTPLILVTLGAIIGDWSGRMIAENEGLHESPDSLTSLFGRIAPRMFKEQSSRILRLIVAFVTIFLVLIAGLWVWLAYMAVTAP